MELKHNCFGQFYVIYTQNIICDLFFIFFSKSRTVLILSFKQLKMKIIDFFVHRHKASLFNFCIQHHFQISLCCPTPLRIKHLGLLHLSVNSWLLALHVPTSSVSNTTNWVLTMFEKFGLGCTVWKKSKNQILRKKLKFWKYRKKLDFT